MRYALIALGGLIVLFTIAYIDGGEEPLHPISHPISLSDQAEVGR
ncbi:MAG: hypothetical protein AAGI28_04055 [Pseudomonadota bacterium]